MQLVLVDSYDSFTYNLVQAFETLGVEVHVVRSDRVDAGTLRALDRPVVLGPGPGRPEDAGCLVSAVDALAGRVPVLGVCLGHQAIALAFGGRVVRHRAVHGHAVPVRHGGRGLFEGIPQDVPMTRYNSLVVAPDHLPAPIEATAWSDDGAIMAIAHRRLAVYGVQFHPESVLSGAHGLSLLRNFLRSAAAPTALATDRDRRPTRPRMQPASA